MKNNPAAIAVVFMVLAGLFFALPCRADTLQAVEQKFDVFARNWVFRIETAYLHTRENPKMAFADGRYQASYFYLAPDSIQTHVKPAAGSTSIFTGVLQYHEYLFQSEGTTREQALAGPFAAASLKKMTEIFLYENGSWMP